MRNGWITALGMALLLCASPAVRAQGCPGCCGDKGPGKCCAKGDAAAAPAPAGEAKLASAGEGASCAKETAGALCPKKALAVAAKVRSTECGGACLQVLASSLPEIKCEKARAKLRDEVKGKKSDEEAAAAILTAFALHVPADGAACAKATEATAAVKGCCGAGKGEATAAVKGCCSGKGEATAAVKGCCSDKGEATAAVKGCGAGKGEATATAAACCKDGGICARKARMVAVRIRQTPCPTASAAILAEALPGLKCRETLAKLVEEIKSQDCDGEAAAVVLAAGSKFTAPKAAPASGDGVAVE